MEANSERDEAAVIGLLAIAHHDIWWAKGHAWQVCNWTLAGVVALASAALSGVRGEYKEQKFWWIAANLLVFLANGYIGRMQADMVTSRMKATALTASYSRMELFRKELEPGYAGSIC